MTISARLQITPAADRRGWTRRSLSLGSSLQATGEDVTVHDVSATGMLIETTAELSILDGLEIELPEAGFTPAVVTWNSGSYYGCQFKESISQAAISAALLRSPPARPGDQETPVRLFPESAHQTIKIDESEVEDIVEEKASLGVRLRVILGSAVLLWALIIWAAVSVYDLI
jgi:hypothetical protein